MISILEDKYLLVNIGQYFQKKIIRTHFFESIFGEFIPKPNPIQIKTSNQTTNTPPYQNQR